jgi:toxin ParE1/3/4
MPELVKAEAAERDLEDHFVYIGMDSLDAAERFLLAAERAFESLAAMPGIGSSYRSLDPRLSGLRFFPIKGFGKYLVFYRPLAQGIEIVRVLHGARDIAAILESLRD